MAPHISKRQLRVRLAQVDQTIQASLRELAALPPKQFAALAPVLLRAQQETNVALSRFLARKDLAQRFTTQLERELLVQLKPVLEEVKRLDPAMYQALTGGRKAARGLATEHVRRQLAAFSIKFEGATGTPLPIARAAAIAEGAGTRLKQYRRSARRYAGAVGENIRSEISLGVLRRESLHQITNRLVRYGGPRGVVNLGNVVEEIPEGLFTRYRYWAHRIVRTEVVEQYNAAAQRELVELHKDDPELLQRWDASLDARMCPLCESLHGRVARPGESFGEGVDHPPAHSNCRCAITAWRRDWG